ncbi:stalk domain-containing protein [Paenibacillus sp. CAU 1782]
MQFRWKKRVQEKGGLSMLGKRTSVLAASFLLALSVNVHAFAASETEKSFGIGDAVRGENGNLLLEVTTIAGSGEPGDRDGAASSAAFRAPQGLLALPDGTLYIADTNNHQIRKLSNGSVSTYAGLKYWIDGFGLPTGVLNDGPADEAEFNTPVGLAGDAAGNLYVADADNHAIRKLSPQGEWTTLAGDGILGRRDGIGKEARFYYPQAIAVDQSGNVYVADSLNHQIRKITPGGTVSTLNAKQNSGVQVMPGLLVESGGYRDGALAQALFNEPSGLALDAKGNLFVSDTGNQVIRYIDLSKGTVSTVAGVSLPAQESSAESAELLYREGGYRDGKASEALFHFPRGLAVTPEGGLLIADSLNHAVRYLLNGEVITLAGGEDGERGWEDGIEGHHGLQMPSAVALGRDGSVLVADSYNNKIRKITLQQLPKRGAGETAVRIVTGTEGKSLAVATELRNGRTLAPVRAVGEALGYNVTYKPETREALLEKDGLAVTLRLNEALALVSRNGGAPVNYELDSAPFVKNGTAYIPVRYISELIDSNVEWHGESKTVIIRGAAAENEGDK